MADERTKKQPGYSILLWTTKIFTLLAIICLLPAAWFSGPFTFLGEIAKHRPLPTLILLAGSATVCVARSRFFRE